MIAKNVSQLLDPIANAFNSIGYKWNLIKKNYEFADFYPPETPRRDIALGIFGQEPINFRSACFGIHFAEPGQHGRDLLRDYRALGAPLIFLITNGKTECWSITHGTPTPFDECKTRQLPQLILSQKNKWNPDEMIRAKSGFRHHGPRQLDFVDIGLLPALEREASKKIDTLISSILSFTEKEIAKRKEQFEAHRIFRIFFHLLTAKLIKDCEIQNADQVDFSNPIITLDFVTRYYGNGEPVAHRNFPADILLEVSRRIGEIFSLKNISVDTLTYIYENTFVTTKNRKMLGIHSTPSYVADYVLSQIPLHELPRSKWSFLDPMCGHGIFLIAAMRRMRGLLPKDWGGRRRHEFFRKALHGVEIDALPVEVARMCLMLADFPESNGWDILHKDVFSGRILEDYVSHSPILIGNPPFEYITTDGHEIPKPALLLRRALAALPDNGLIGLVLPRTFMDGSDYRTERDFILKNFEILSLTSLPDKIFLYSDAETALITARKQEGSGKNYTLYREVKDHHKEAFRTQSAVTWKQTVPQLYFTTKQGSRLTVPFLYELWERLEGLPFFEDIADVKIGVQYEPTAVKEKTGQIVQGKPFPGSKPGISSVTNGFIVFEAKDTIYMSTDESLRRKRALGAWDLDWSKPKVVIPASRTSRGPWRYAAAIDREGRLVSRRFYAVWPKEEIVGVELLAALLNSPIAEAYTYAHSFQRDIPARAYKSIPIPDNIVERGFAIDSLVKQYLQTLETDYRREKEILLQIDAEILKLYNLPPQLERQLLDIFWGTRRRVPFAFDGYIPPEKLSSIPLHIYLSQQYKNATPKKILDRIPEKPNKEMAEYIKEVWERTP